uniref:T9SS type A sorting domain-containing protein n=3 Tax=candidate division WOR-3 bacterium TaxID=2052148 RepID=A0A7C1SF59_UNCW3
MLPTDGFASFPEGEKIPDGRIGLGVGMIRKFHILLICGIWGASTVCAQEIVWLRRFDRERNEYSSGLAFEQDSSLLIAGYSQNPAYGKDILLLKYTASGDSVLSRLYDGGEDEVASSIATDRSGNIIVAGWCSNDPVETQCLLIKFSPDGNCQWRREYRTGDMDFFTGVGIDDSSNIIVIGTSYSYSGGGRYTGLIQKYDENGNLIWNRLYRWAATFWELILLADGGFVVTGTDTTLVPVLTVRFDSAGDTVWSRSYREPGGVLGEGFGLARDSSGNIIVTGYSCIDTDYDCILIKYNPAGDIVWHRKLNFGRWDWATGVAADRSGNIYLSGSSGSAEDTTDYLIVKLTPDGSIVWSRCYDGGHDDKAGKVVVDAENNPVVTGASDNGTDSDVLTIKFQEGAGVQEKPDHSDLPHPFEIFPNPAQSYISVKFLPFTVPDKVRIFDQSGRLVAEFSPLSHQQDGIRISLAGKTAGIYFVVIGRAVKSFVLGK